MTAESNDPTIDLGPGANIGNEPDDRGKDVLRGGSGERGTPTDPPTNDDLLGGGAGERRPTGPDVDLDQVDAGSQAERVEVVEGAVGSAKLKEPQRIEDARDERHRATGLADIRAGRP